MRVRLSTHANPVTRNGVIRNGEGNKMATKENGERFVNLPPVFTAILFPSLRNSEGNEMVGKEDDVRFVNLFPSFAPAILFSCMMSPWQLSCMTSP